MFGEMTAEPAGVSHEAVDVDGIPAMWISPPVPPRFGASTWIDCCRWPTGGTCGRSAGIERRWRNGTARSVRAAPSWRHSSNSCRQRSQRAACSSTVRRSPGSRVPFAYQGCSSQTLWWLRSSSRLIVSLH